MTTDTRLAQKAITVQALVEALQGLDQRAHVLISKDPEGNAFFHLDSIEPGAHYRNLRWGAVDVDVTDGQKAVILWPQ
jgi:hypothetical protein